ncbi:MAG: calcium-binding protein [Planctomycetota bacterium]
MSRKRTGSELKLGDSVVVKAGVQDPDFGTDLGGWQGRITDIERSEQEGVLITITWDSVTLKGMPGSVIERCEEEGMSWTECVLLADDVEGTKPRDSDQDAGQVTAELADKYAWSALGEQGRRINRVLTSGDPVDEENEFDAWERYLKAHLVFPFEAKVNEHQDRGPLPIRGRITLTGIGPVDEYYGIMVNVSQGRSEYTLPLCDLTVVERRSTNHQPVDDYCTWFANR